MHLFIQEMHTFARHQTLFTPKAESSRRILEDAFMVPSMWFPKLRQAISKAHAKYTQLALLKLILDMAP